MINFVLSSLLIVAILGLVFAHRFDASQTPVERTAPIARPLAVALATVTICASFYGWHALVETTGYAQRPLPLWLARLPSVVIDDRAPLFAHAPFGTIALVIVLAQTAGLTALYLTLRGKRTSRASVVILTLGFASMSVIAFGTTVMTSFDTYAYAGAAHRGIAGGYAPNSEPFAHDWSALNAIYGPSIPPSPYGPVWQLAASLASGWAPTLGLAIACLRVLEFVALCACIASVRFLDSRSDVRALLLLNPTLFVDFIIDGHNDLVAVALVLAAMALSRRAWIFALVLAACAAAVKLPFLLIAPLAFAYEPDARRRLLRAAGVVVLGLAISAIFGGAPYVHAIAVTGSLFHTNLAQPWSNALRATIGLASALAVVYTLVWRRSSSTASWSFLALSAAFFGWYLAWGLPYAMTERRWTAAFLIALPIANFVLSTTFATTFYTVLAFVATFLLAPTLAAFALRRNAKTYAVADR